MIEISHSPLVDPIQEIRRYTSSKIDEIARRWGIPRYTGQAPSYLPFSPSISAPAVPSVQFFDAGTQVSTASGVPVPIAADDSPFPQPSPPVPSPLPAAREQKNRVQPVSPSIPHELRQSLSATPVSMSSPTPLTDSASQTVTTERSKSRHSSHHRSHRRRSPRQTPSRSLSLESQESLPSYCVSDENSTHVPIVLPPRDESHGEIWHRVMSKLPHNPPPYESSEPVLSDPGTIYATAQRSLQSMLAEIDITMARLSSDGSFSQT